MPLGLFRDAPVDETPLPIIVLTVPEELILRRELFLIGGLAVEFTPSETYIFVPSLYKDVGWANFASVPDPFANPDVDPAKMLSIEEVCAYFMIK